MNRSMSILSALLMALSLVGITPAAAEESVKLTVPEAPVITPVAAAKNVWRIMNVDSFPRTVDAAVGQCQREARRIESDRLTLAHCATFRQKLTSSQCSFVSVADGQVYAALLGRVQTLSDATKRTGRSDLATRCDIGDGITFDWYNGQPGVSCFNVGIIIAPLPVEPVVVVVEQPKKKPSCRYVTRTRQTQSGGGLYLQAVYLPGCDCCGSLYVPSLVVPPTGGVDNTVETILVCN